MVTRHECTNSCHQGPSWQECSKELFRWRSAVPQDQITSREHFPDAYIFETIKDLLRELGEVNIVTNDINLGESCASLDKARNFKRLEDFITSPACHSLLRHQDFEEQVQHVLDELEERITYLEDGVNENIVDALAGQSIENDYFPSDDKTAYIEGVDRATDIEFDFSEAVYIGEGTINIPFVCNVEVQASFYIFKGDYYLLPEERQERVSAGEYDNRHYYDAEETVDVRVQGVLSVEFDLSTLVAGEEISSKMDDLLKDATLEIDSIQDMTLVKSLDL